MKNKLLSFFVLILSSLIPLSIAMIPIARLILSKETAGVEIFAYLTEGFFVKFPLCVIASFILYRISTRILRITRINVAILVLLIVIISSLNFTWYSLYLEYFSFRSAREKATFNVFFRLENEQFIEVNNKIGDPEYPNVNPNKYEYHSKILIDNQTNKTYEDVFYRILPDVGNEQIFLTESRGSISIYPGQGYIESKLPVRFFHEVESFPFNEVRLRIFLKPDWFDKDIYLKSNLNWKEVFEEQLEFFNQYSRRRT